MSTIINADTSDGLKFTSDTSGEIKLQSAGTDIATINSTGITMASGKTLPATSLTTATGSAPSYSARAWVNFNGTGTVAIRASGNVSSITDNGTGDYTVNFTTAMPDINYSATIGWRVFSSVNIRAGGFNNYTTGSIDVYGGYRGGSNAFTAEDATFVSVAIFR